ncbi:Hypothetical predicted protein [Marmota monax]|uniref:Uncharacterized protein n=1 Tax=Marmota monax TaxID=9995 RepID=A0A5E4CX21_MARMO|nr:Hypothetical predicted protein [Marmota monax]
MLPWPFFMPLVCKTMLEGKTISCFMVVMGSTCACLRSSSQCCATSCCSRSTWYAKNLLLRLQLPTSRRSPTSWKSSCRSTRNTDAQHLSTGCSKAAPIHCPERTWWLALVLGLELGEHSVHLYPVCFGKCKRLLVAKIYSSCA